jgi:hypothetical protein
LRGCGAPDGIHDAFGGAPSGKESAADTTRVPAETLGASSCLYCIATARAVSVAFSRHDHFLLSFKRAAVPLRTACKSAQFVVKRHPWTLEQYGAMDSSRCTTATLPSECSAGGAALFAVDHGMACINHSVWQISELDLPSGLRQTPLRLAVVRSARTSAIPRASSH